MKKESNWQKAIDEGAGIVGNYPIVLSSIRQEDIWGKKNSVIYIHIPFCKKVCSFCCYNLTKNIFNLEIEERYVNALIKEISASSWIVNSNLDNFFKVIHPVLSRG
jgi:coproporphyrinogen III oxidase-like Fe-S oxidoreductase